MAFPPSTARSFQLRSKWVTVPTARVGKKNGSMENCGEKLGRNYQTSVAWWKHQMHRNKKNHSEILVLQPLTFPKSKITRILSKLQQLFSPGAIVTQHVTNERTTICSNLVVPRFATQIRSDLPIHKYWMLQLCGCAEALQFQDSVDPHGLWTGCPQWPLWMRQATQNDHKWIYSARGICMTTAHYSMLDWAWNRVKFYL